MTFRSRQAGLAGAVHVLVRPRPEGVGPCDQSPDPPGGRSPRLSAPLPPPAMTHAVEEKALSLRAAALGRGRPPSLSPFRELSPVSWADTGGSRDG